MKIVSRLSIMLICLATCGCANTWLLMPEYGEMDAHGAKSHFIRLGDENIEIFTAANSASAPCGSFVLEFTGNATRVLSRFFPKPCRGLVEFSGRTVGPELPRLRKILRPTAHVSHPRGIPCRIRCPAPPPPGLNAPIFIAGNSLGTTAAALCRNQAIRRRVALAEPTALEGTSLVELRLVESLADHGSDGRAGSQ